MTEKNDKLARRTCRVLDYKHTKETGDPRGSKGIKYF